MEEVKKKRKGMKLPNGYGSITKMSGRRRKPWRARVTTGWTPEGKQIYKNIGTYATRAEAMEALAVWNVNPVDQPAKIRRDAIVQGMTFADMYNAFLQYKGEKISDDMAATYRVAYKQLEPLHQLIFSQIKKPHLQDVFDNCTKSSATKSKMKVLINALYKYATEHELVEKDYSKQIDMEAKKNEKDYQPFSEEEIETIWTHADAGDDVAKIILLQIYTGTRINELLEITKENVHLADCYMIGGKKTDNGKNRIIPLHSRVVPILEEFYQQDRPHLFTNRTGARLKYHTFLYHFDKRMEEWQMDHTTHDARRTAATRLHVADVPLEIIAQILGHSQQQITMKAYIKKDVKHLVKYVNAVK